MGLRGKPQTSVANIELATLAPNQSSVPFNYVN